MDSIINMKNLGLWLKIWYTTYYTRWSVANTDIDHTENLIWLFPYILAITHLYAFEGFGGGCQHKEKVKMSFFGKLEVFFGFFGVFILLPSIVQYLQSWIMKPQTRVHSTPEHLELLTILLKITSYARMIQIRMLQNLKSPLNKILEPTLNRLATKS